MDYTYVLLKIKSALCEGNLTPSERLDTIREVLSMVENAPSNIESMQCLSIKPTLAVKAVCFSCNKMCIRG